MSYLESASMPFFTILTAVLNRRVEIEQMLDSLFSQDFDDYELVVVDNGSTDGSYEFCQSIDDPRVRVVTCSKRGLSFARNTGARVAKGTWVLILDSDNWLSDISSLGQLKNVLSEKPQIDCLLTRSVDKEGNILASSSKLDDFLAVVDYFRSVGEFSAVFRREWFVNNLFPEVDGAITEFPAVVIARAAEGGNLFVSSKLMQTYSTDSGNRICSSSVTDRRSFELYTYYGMLLSSYGDVLFRDLPGVYIAFLIKYVVYGRLSGLAKIRKIISMRLGILVVPILWSPRVFLRRLIELKKLQGA